MLQIRESWLRKKATARAIPCTFLGKHLRFSEDDINRIIKAGVREPVTSGQARRRQHGRQSGRQRR